MDTLNCKIVLIPTQDRQSPLQQGETGIIIYLDRDANHLDIWTDGTHHLYAISDRDIEEGDYVVNFENKMPIVYKSTGLKGQYNKRKKIEGSTDKTMEIPTLPASFIRAYVAGSDNIAQIAVSTWSDGLCKHLDYPMQQPRRQGGEGAKTIYGEVNIEAIYTAEQVNKNLKLKTISPEIVQLMREKGPEMYLLLGELYIDAAKGGIKRSLILEKVKRLFEQNHFPLTKTIFP